MIRRSTRKNHLDEVLGRPYWRSGDAERVLEAWRQSGQSMAAFAREQGLSRARLARWHGRLRDRPVAFHPVRVVGDSPGLAKSVRPTTVDLVLAGGRRVVVGRGFDPELLEKLVRVVEGWRC